MSVLVLLPVSAEAWDEIARAVTERGQGDRVDTRRATVNLSDVALLRQVAPSPPRRVDSGTEKRGRKTPC